MLPAFFILSCGSGGSKTTFASEKDEQETGLFYGSSEIVPGVDTEDAIQDLSLDSVRTEPEHNTEYSEENETNRHLSGQLNGELFFRLTPYSETDKTLYGKKYPSVPRIGMKKFNEYLSRAMSWHEHAGGECVLVFHVNQYGRPSSIRAVSGFSREANREAIRLLESGPEWTPTDQDVELTIIF